jgi:hypothetical protein
MASMDELLKIIRTDMQTSFDTVLGQLHSVSNAVNETTKELRAFKDEMRSFKKEVGVRLDGLGNYLRYIDGNTSDHGTRIGKLEMRVDNIEKRLGA